VIVPVGLGSYPFTSDGTRPVRRTYTRGRHQSADRPGGDVKISMFHLMPHRELPADFEQRYKSKPGHRA
jgi:hypothetical protein